MHCLLVLGLLIHCSLAEGSWLKRCFGALTSPTKSEAPPPDQNPFQPPGHLATKPESIEDLFFSGESVQTKNGVISVQEATGVQLVVKVYNSLGIQNLGPLGSKKQNALLEKFPGLRIQPAGSIQIQGNSTWPDYYVLTFDYPEAWNAAHRANTQLELFNALISDL